MRRTLALSLTVALAALSTGGPLAAQEPTGPSPSPPASAAPSGSPDASLEATVTATVTFEEPRWRRLSPPRGPDAREDHTWTVDGDGRYAYLFGGRDGNKDFGDLWRFDLESDTWHRLSPRGRTPDARFGHSAVWVERIGLVVFAGQQGVDFFGDLWVYDPTADRWRELPANGEAPRARYGSCMIVGRDGRLWISHGFTFAGRFDDTRAYNLERERWASIAPDGRRPGERCLHDCWTSSSGELVLYGGQDDDSRALGDLWVMRKNGTWKQQAQPRLKARRLYAVTEAGEVAYVFGGADRAGDTLDDLWLVDRTSHAFRRVRVEGDSPAARSAGTLVTDAARGRLLLFGGRGGSAMADVWELDEGVPPEIGDTGIVEASPAASPSVPPEPEA